MHAVCWCGDELTLINVCDRFIHTLGLGYTTPQISLSSNKAQRTHQTTRYVIGKQFSREISFIHACVRDTRPGYVRKVRRPMGKAQRIATKKKCHQNVKEEKYVFFFLFIIWLFDAECRAHGTHTFESDGMSRPR